jgi:hypothetical protein
MAIRVGTTKETILVISKIDDAIPENLTSEAHGEYLKTLDESLLGLGNAIPTRFVLKKTLSFAAQKHIEDVKMGVNDEGKAEFKFGFMMETIRFALVGIENPPDMPPEQQLVFKKEADGFASRELIAYLNSAGIVQELFVAHQSASKPLVQKK